MPNSRHLAPSPRKPAEVSMMMTDATICPSCLIFSATENPSISGIWASSKTNAKGFPSAVGCQDMRYTGCQDIRYTSRSWFFARAGLAGSPEGDRRALPTSCGSTSGRVHRCRRSISRTYMCR
jgi:hypothetical protein